MNGFCAPAHVTAMITAANSAHNAPNAAYILSHDHVHRPDA